MIAFPDPAINFAERGLNRTIPKLPAKEPIFYTLSRADSGLRPDGSKR